MPYDIKHKTLRVEGFANTKHHHRGQTMQKPSKLNITIELGSSAIEAGVRDGETIAVLRTLIGRIEEGDCDEIRLRDSNGNMVGQAVWT